MTTQQLATSQGWDLNEARRYGRALCNAYLTICKAIEDYGYPRYRASQFAMQLTEEQTFIIASRKPESIVRAYKQWWEVYKLTEEAENLALVALCDKWRMKLKFDLRKALTDAL